jgi:hypothetical protein
MGLDIRLPIGLLFVALGGLLAVYGLISDRAIYQRSLDININLWWGLAMLIFGILMVLGGRGKGVKGPQSGTEERGMEERRSH